MSKFKEHYRVLQYRPQAAKSLRSTLHSFIRREFPRLGGSWVVWTLVDKLLEIVDSYRFFHGKLKPGQVVWPAVAVDERPVYRKPMWRTRQVPVIVVTVQRMGKQVECDGLVLPFSKSAAYEYNSDIS